MIRLTDNEFIRFVTYIKTNFGIDLKKKKVLIESRLSKELADRGLDNYSDLIDIVEKDKTGHEVDKILNKITTNHTYFMRENKHFDFLKDILKDEFIQNRSTGSINIWSAGCSSGPEPYTIAMIINEVLGNKKLLWNVNVIASDISQKVLTIAKEGTYKAESLEEIPKEWKLKYFDDNNDGTYTAKQIIKKDIKFKTINLMKTFNFNYKFDVIFCRNVMIYFDQQTKDTLVKKFYDQTKNNGYLFVGLAENVNRCAAPYRYISSSTYKKI